MPRIIRRQRCDFSANCTDCICKKRVKAPKPLAFLCPEFAAFKRPDPEGDCYCPLQLECFQNSKLGCRSSNGPTSTRHFQVGCSNCSCKQSLPSSSPVISLGDGAGPSHSPTLFGGQATTLQPLHLTAFPRAQATTSFQAASLSHPTEFVVSHEAVAIAGEVSSEVIEFSVVARPEAAGQAAARSQLPHPLAGEQHA